MSYKLELAKDHQIRVVVSSPKATLPAVLGPFSEQIKGQPAFTFSMAADFPEINEHVQPEENGAIAIICIQDKDEFVHVLQFLSNNEKRIQLGTMKVFVFSRMNQPRVLSILKSKGVFDLPEFNITLKAFGYKIQKAVQLIEQGIENVKRSSSIDTQNAAIKAGRAQNGPRGNITYKVMWEKPIEHYSDFWLLLNQRHARYVIGKWMINFYGPGPGAGTWELTALEENGEKGWMFNPRTPGDQTFYQDDGRWVFFGNCPEFSWEQRIWYFISKKPSLYFYKGKEIAHKKVVFLESGDIQFHTNSEAGKSLKGAIAATIEASIHLHTDREKKKGNVVIENELREGKELSAELAPEDLTEFDYRGKKDAGGQELEYEDHAEESAELSGKFTNDPQKEIEKAESTFESTELQINITAKNGQAMSEHDPIRLVELRDTQAIIDIPIGLLVVGDQIEVDAFVQDGKKTKKLSFSASTKIIENDFTGDDLDDQKRAAAICELNQSIKGHFTDVVDQLQAKRELLEQFFKKAKGA